MPDLGSSPPSQCGCFGLSRNKNSSAPVAPRYSEATFNFGLKAQPVVYDTDSDRESAPSARAHPDSGCSSDASGRATPASAASAASVHDSLRSLDLRAGGNSAKLGAGKTARRRAGIRRFDSAMEEAQAAQLSSCAPEPPADEEASCADEPEDYCTEHSLSVANLASAPSCLLSTTATMTTMATAKAGALETAASTVEAALAIAASLQPGDPDWLAQRWQINPSDIFFASRSNGKLCRLGKGGFGTVYKGMFKERPVAVKVCRQPDITGPKMRQFQKEVAILQGCTHPNVVSLIGACTWKGGKRTVLVTEFMERGDLYALLGRGSTRFAWARLGRGIALDVARGLAFLHVNNIVHFDLKSANILLDRSFAAKLADVGLAKTLTHYHGDALATVMATNDLGTFAWAAPEVLLGMPCNDKADIYSFGVVLWELATNQVPQNRDLRPISVPQEGPAELSMLINYCLQPVPEKRPTAARLVEILELLQ